MPDLTKAQRAMLQRIADHSPILELSLVASGGRSYDVMKSLMREELVRGCDHPTVKVTGTKYPADAVEITDAGRAALKSGAPDAKEPRE